MQEITCKDRLQAIDILMKSESLEELSRGELVVSIKHILNKKGIRPNSQRLLDDAVAKVNDLRK